MCEAAARLRSFVSSVLRRSPSARFIGLSPSPSERVDAQTSV